MNSLYSAIETWEEETGKSCGCGDDGFNDLRAMIVGIGKLEYEAVMADPERAYNRATAPYGSPEGYRESFAYAIPYEDAYDAPEVQEARKRESMVRHVEHLEENLTIAREHVEHLLRQWADAKAALDDYDKTPK
jgi:hypothetical protein